jgi:hypoxanthine phosphoribosyltransferase
MKNTQLLYSHDQIKARIQEVGSKISQDYKGKEILAVGLLKGCAVFFSHLLVNIEGHIEIDFITISSYKHGTKSKDFKFVQDLDSEVNGRHILIIEDIIDTGKTIKFVTNHLKTLGAASVEVAVFVYKTSNLQHKIDKPKYICFEYSDPEFLVGFGFDLSGRHRNLQDVYKLVEG